MNNQWLEIERKITPLVKRKDGAMLAARINAMMEYRAVRRAGLNLPLGDTLVLLLNGESLSPSFTSKKSAAVTPGVGLISGGMLVLNMSNPSLNTSVAEPTLETYAGLKRR